MLANLRAKLNERIQNFSAPQDSQDKRINELVDRATSDILIGPDWGTNMELVDVINSDPRVNLEKSTRALKRALQSTNSKVQMLTLTVLETCIKNCSRSFHRHLVMSDLFNEMLRIAQSPPSLHVNSEVKDRILCLVEDLAKALGGAYRDAYEYLLDNGVDFPVRAPEDMVPLEIPAEAPEPTSSLAADISEEDRAAIQQAMDELAAEEQRQQQQQQQQQQNAVPATGVTVNGSLFNAAEVRGVPQEPVTTAAAAPPVSPRAPVPAPPPVTHLPGSSPQEVMQAATVSQEVLAAALAEIPEAHPEGVKEAYIGEVAAQCRAQRSQLADVVETCTDESLLAQALSLYENLQRTIEQYNALLVRSQSFGATQLVDDPNPTSAAAPALPPSSAPFAGPQFTISEEDEADEGLVTRRNNSLPTAPVPILPPPPSAPASALSPREQQMDMIDLDSDHGSPVKAGLAPEKSSEQMIDELDRLVLNTPPKTSQ